MKIAVTGSNGYMGRNLVRELKEASHDVLLVKRTVLYRVPELMKVISGANVVIHLAGAPILQRWTPKAKDEIMNSRAITTRNLAKAISELPASERPQLFISASAIGIYSANGHHTEASTSYAENFVGDVVKQWEKSSEEIEKSVRRVVFRIGIVLGNGSQTMRQLVPIFKFGLGGKVASGKQPFPFIHIQDVTRAIIWAIEKKEVWGIYNLVAPQQITNIDFTKSLASVLHRPALFTVPAFALKLIYGEAASLILQNSNVYPERLIRENFQFKYPDINSCLEACIKKPR